METTINPEKLQVLMSKWQGSNDNIEKLAGYACKALLHGSSMFQAVSSLRTFRNMEERRLERWKNTYASHVRDGYDVSKIGTQDIIDRVQSDLDHITAIMHEIVEHNW